MKYTTQAPGRQLAEGTWPRCGPVHLCRAWCACSSEEAPSYLPTRPLQCAAGAHLRCAPAPVRSVLWSASELYGVLNFEPRLRASRCIPSRFFRAPCSPSSSLWQAPIGYPRRNRSCRTTPSPPAPAVAKSAADGAGAGSRRHSGSQSRSKRDHPLSWSKRPDRRGKNSTAAVRNS